jgi:hypothetical protein
LWVAFSLFSWLYTSCVISDGSLVSDEASDCWFGVDPCGLRSATELHPSNDDLRREFLLNHADSHPRIPKQREMPVCW